MFRVGLLWAVVDCWLLLKVALLSNRIQKGLTLAQVVFRGDASEWFVFFCLCVFLVGYFILVAKWASLGKWMVELEGTVLICFFFLGCFIWVLFSFVLLIPFHYF